VLRWRPVRSCTVVLPSAETSECEASRYARATRSAAEGHALGGVHQADQLGAPIAAADVAGPAVGLGQPGSPAAVWVRPSVMASAPQPGRPRTSGTMP
jgi:hypothetical protein